MPLKVVTIVGARPQFIKAAPISRCLRREHTEVLLHTGQHYDYGMSQVFFDELDMPEPDINLGVGSAGHAEQTAKMLVGIERVLKDLDPDWTLVYGDTNSTLAGALAAAKLNMPVAHVEAGLRSFNRCMPEEINRVLVDHLADLLLCPTQASVDNLSREGIVEGVHLVGDVMYDAVMHNGTLASQRSKILRALGVGPKSYTLLTIHRPANTDDPERLAAILEACNTLEEPIVFPCHPRTREALHAQEHAVPPNVRVMAPVGYLDMLQLEQQARVILTDSGGIQKEAYFFGIPCVTLREETEWVETVASGWNHLVGADPAQIVFKARNPLVPEAHPRYYGNGSTAEQTVLLLAKNASKG